MEGYEDKEHDTLDAVIAERLPLLDKMLAKTGIELKDRPFRATFEFIEIWVLEVNDGQGRQFKPTISAEIVTERWFAALYQLIERWYHNRYGEAFRATSSRALTGFVPIWSTVFELAVPREVVQSDVPGETVWLRFPGRVLEAEDPLAWLRSPPSLGQLSQTESENLRSAVNEVAARLRAINVAIMGIPERDKTLSGFLVAIRSHLELAAKKAVAGGHPELETGFWDLHMATECAFKSLIHRKIGKFPRRHDLDELYNIAASHLRAFPSEELEKLPKWREAIEHRYGGGIPVNLDEYWTLYMATLRIIESALEPLVVLRIGEGQVKIARPPWKKAIT
jgi:HEPN domain-containing protein